VTWQLGPGARVGVVGVNGSGKTTLLRLLAGAIGVPGSAGGLRTDGTMVTGKTVRIGYLTQEPAQVEPGLRALEAAEQARGSVRIGKRELSASQLLERLGLRRERQWTPVAELSGGEQRRLQFQLVLMTEPNVLLLDEPTNDLDIETLTELEDLLDGFPGSIVVVSHDRYFLERVTDHIVALIGGKLAFLPGGVEEYLDLRDRGEAELAATPTRADQVPARTRVQAATGAGSRARTPGPGAGSGDGAVGAGSGSERLSASPAGATAERQRQVKKELARLDRQLEKLAGQESDLEQALALAATDYERLIELGGQLRALHAEKEGIEERWLALAEEISG